MDDNKLKELQELLKLIENGELSEELKRTEE